MIRRMKLRYKILAPLGLAFLLLCIAKPSIALAPVRMIGIQLTPQAATPFATGKGGLWIKSSDYSINYRNPNTNADTALGAGGGGGGTGTLQQSYTAGGAGPQVLLEDATRLGIAWKAYAGQTADIWDIQASGGAVMVGVTPAGLLTFAPTATTALTASTESNDFNVNLARTVQFATGALTTQRAVYVQAPTYGFVGASTITNAATLAISGAPTAGTNATITNSYALWVGAGMRVDGTIYSTSTMNFKSDAANTVPGYILNVSNSFTADNAPLWKMTSNGNTIWTLETWTGFGGYVGESYYYAGSLVGGWGFSNSQGYQPSLGGASLNPHNNNNNAIGSVSAGLAWTSAYIYEYTTPVQTIAAATSITINPANGEEVRVTLSGTAITGITMSAGSQGETMITQIIGAGTIGGWPTNAHFAGNTAPTWTNSATKRDIITWRYDSTDAIWYETARSLNVTN